MVRTKKEMENFRQHPEEVVAEHIALSLVAADSAGIPLIAIQNRHIQYILNVFRVQVSRSQFFRFETGSP